MIDPLVRRAVAADAAALQLLEAEARQVVEGQRGGVRWLRDHPAQGDVWAEVIGRADTHVHVAHIDDVVVGYLLVRLERQLARVDDVYVTPEARELGFGDALLEAAIVDARAAGATTLDGEALPGDRHVKNLYERAGITARLIVVSTDL